MLEVRGLVNRFGGQVVHDGLDMQVYARRGLRHRRRLRVAGKSVLLRTILGLQRPQAGVVRIERPRPRAAVACAVARSQGGLRGDIPAGALYSALTVLQNVQLPMIEHLQLEAEARSTELAHAQDPPGRLAGGRGATSIRRSSPAAW